MCRRRAAGCSSPAEGAGTGPTWRGSRPGDAQGPTLGDILHPQDGTETAEEPYTEGAMAEVPEKYTLGPGTWATLVRHKENHGRRGNGFGYTIADPAKPARTLTARYAKDGQEILIEQPGNRPRRLTPRECARADGDAGVGDTGLRHPSVPATWELGGAIAGGGRGREACGGG